MTVTVTSTVGIEAYYIIEHASGDVSVVAATANFGDLAIFAALMLCALLLAVIMVRQWTR